MWVDLHEWYIELLQVKTRHETQQKCDGSRFDVQNFKSNDIWVAPYRTLCVLPAVQAIQCRSSWAGLGSRLGSSPSQDPFSVATPSQTQGKIGHCWPKWQNPGSSGCLNPPQGARNHQFDTFKVCCQIIGQNVQPGPSLGNCLPLAPILDLLWVRVSCTVEGEWVGGCCALTGWGAFGIPVTPHTKGAEACCSTPFFPSTVGAWLGSPREMLHHTRNVYCMPTPCSGHERGLVRVMGALGTSLVLAQIPGPPLTRTKPWFTAIPRGIHLNLTEPCS